MKLLGPANDLVRKPQQSTEELLHLVARAEKPVGVAAVGWIGEPLAELRGRVVDEVRIEIVDKQEERLVRAMGASYRALRPFRKDQMRGRTASSRDEMPGQKPVFPESVCTNRTVPPAVRLAPFS